MSIGPHTDKLSRPPMPSVVLATTGLLSLLLLFLASLTSACIPLTGSDACSNDSDCDSDEVCTDISECSTAADAPSWKIRWTINGVDPNQNPASCESIARLSLTITSIAETLSFTPIRCQQGSFNFRALPLTFSTIRLTAFDVNDNPLGRARQSNGRIAAEITLDLSVSSL